MTNDVLYVSPKALAKALGISVRTLQRRAHMLPTPVALSTRTLRYEVAALKDRGINVEALFSICAGTDQQPGASG